MRPWRPAPWGRPKGRRGRSAIRGGDLSKDCHCRESGNPEVTQAQPRPSPSREKTLRGRHAKTLSFPRRRESRDIQAQARTLPSREQAARGGDDRVWRERLRTQRGICARQCHWQALMRRPLRRLPPMNLIRGRRPVSRAGVRSHFRHDRSLDAPEAGWYYRFPAVSTL